MATLLWDARFSLVTIALAGFGRAAAEVGAVMIVGGNIDGFTRVMTTTIALETSKGDLPLAIGLGLVLIARDPHRQRDGLGRARLVRAPCRDSSTHARPRPSTLPIVLEAVAFAAGDDRASCAT